MIITEDKEEDDEGDREQVTSVDHLSVQEKKQQAD